MVRTQKRLHRTVLSLTVAAVAFASLGVVAVTAMPSRMHIAKSEIGMLQPLAGGPAIMLAKAAPGAAEDCVRVTRMTGPDGKEYPTNGMICGGQ